MMANAIPEPPSDLKRRSLPMEQVAAGSLVYRVHATVRPPKFFGRSTRWRFDAPDGSYGVLYCGLAPEVAFAETLLRGGHFVAFEEIEKRPLCEFRAIRTLRLVRLYGPSMGRIGASAGVTSGSDYAISRHWSKAIYDHPAMVDGILYRATYDNDQLAAVLFDRAQDALDDGRSAAFTSDLGLLGRILDHYGASTR
jgi:RES domain-containing protein